MTVWAWNSPYSGCWELDRERIEDPPTEVTVRQELADDPEAGAYASEITLCPTWGEVTREARALLEPGRAVICHVVIRAETCLTSEAVSPGSRTSFTRSRDLPRGG
ncbi:hypothetical protein OG949_40560 (plasmid) [Streptomyces scopuliridis]|uniref:hypothetical protein n=1 Tax=Streptomyces scopuliridis TaxID=452529 RepID=UPI002DD8F5C1|nr:hypothetical protein [Streptomyces scopuliridis]WSB39051.1 hypothetical protein OG949_40560 [Streptomyces scopuliridis]